MRLLADTLTATRLLFSVVIVRLGLTAGAGALDKVTYCILLGWTADTLDGHVARLDRSGRQTWFSRNDETVDAVFVVSSLFYLTWAGLVHWAFSLVYLCAGWLLLLLFHSRSLLIALEAPLGVLPAIVAFIERPPLGWAYVGWAGVAFALDHRRFFVRLRLFSEGWRQTERVAPAPKTPSVHHSGKTEA